MKIATVGLFCLAACSCLAGGGQIGGGETRIIVPMDRSEPYRAADVSWVSLRIPVDGIAVRVQLKCREGDADARLLDLERADKVFHDSAPPGSTILDTPNMELLPDRPGLAGHYDYADGRGQTLTRYIVFPAAKVTSLAALNKGVKEFLDQGRWSKNVSAEATGFLAVIAKPQQYRTKVLQLIQEDVANVKTVFGTNTTVRLDGLQNPLTARIVTDREADLLMSYRMTIETR